MSAVDYSRLFEIDSMEAWDEEEILELKKLHDEARRYIDSFRWSGEIKRVLFGMGIGGVVGVFLFELAPARPDVDKILWVVVGDLPPAHLVTDEAPEPDLALEVYIYQMRRWVEAVKAGGDLADVIPVNAPPTIENAADLESRLNMLETEILPWYRQGDDGDA
ncbi:hypothetical protein [Hypericibacter sp.]|uniref:hypothetical protein n=1 Tax=Hypericibacter sp. TaxID=2705401 RepID=UPI003D6D05B6